MHAVFIVTFSIVIVKSVVCDSRDASDYSDDETEALSNEVYSQGKYEDEGEKKKASIVMDEEPSKGLSLKHQTQLGNKSPRAMLTLVNYPFSVSVQRKGAHYANGALVNKRWILTSAGEFYFVREAVKLFRARLGSVDCKKGGFLVPIKRIEIHPNYVYGQPDFDVAMLRVAQPVHYTDFIKPISLTTENKQIVSAKFMITYWPRLIVNGVVLPTIASERVRPYSMRVSTQKLIPKDKCVPKAAMNLDESTLCLVPIVSHHTRCVPDPGAPVVAHDGLWGITSGWISKNCNVTQSPIMFTRISAPQIQSWVDTQMQTI